jgi:sn-glycerol 3-phosphate transport system ATP-binding protein
LATVSLQDIRKSYGPTEVIHGVSIDIADGEFVVLVGPSGCGKSTLLRMVAGLESVTSGTLRIGERVVNALEPAERDIAMVFQNYALYPHMSVRNNLAYGLKNRGIDRGEIDRRVAEAAAMLEIAPYLDRRPRQLSGGQRQRVAMGRALVREPAAFLFDEPLSNLDAKLRVQMRVEIRRLQRRVGTTSLYVTHDQIEALTLADRLVVLNGGVVEQIGTPEEVFDRPATLFVAGFIGTPPMNIVPVTWLRETGAGLEGLPASADLVGIRPDDLMLEAPAGPHLTVPATLELIEPAGGETHLYVRWQGLDRPGTVRTQGRPALADGAALDLHVRPEAMHPFAEATGRRV